MSSVRDIEKINETLEILEEKDKLDEALRRAVVKEKCNELGTEFIEHFQKVYKEPNADAVQHWIKEMKNWFELAKKQKFKSSNDVVDRDNLKKWFFYIDDVSFDYEKRKIYVKFVDELLDCGDVKQAFENAGVHIEKRS